MDLQANYDRFRQKDTVILALAVQDVERAQRMQAITGASFPILADPDHRVADRYGVFDRLGDGVAAPAVFVIDRAGQIVWSYIGQHASDRPSAAEILTHLPDQP